MASWRDLGKVHYEPQTAFDATAHPAGSPEKVELLRRRLAGGAPLFHPNDNPLRVDGPGDAAGRANKLKLIQALMGRREL